MMNYAMDKYFFGDIYLADAATYLCRVLMHLVTPILLSFHVIHENSILAGELAVTCDAESVPTSTVPCKLVQDTADDLDWHRRSGKTPTGATMNRMLGDMYYPVTGPGYAHQGEFYLYIDASEANYTSTAR